MLGWISELSGYRVGCVWYVPGVNLWLQNAYSFADVSARAMKDYEYYVRTY